LARRTPAQKTPWPKSLPEHIDAVQATLYDLGEATPEQKRPANAPEAVHPLLESHSALGQTRTAEGGSLEYNSRTLSQRCYCRSLQRH